KVLPPPKVLQPSKGPSHPEGPFASPGPRERVPNAASPRPTENQRLTSGIPTAFQGRDQSRSRPHLAHYNQPRRKSCTTWIARSASSRGRSWSSKQWKRKATNTSSSLAASWEAYSEEKWKPAKPLRPTNHSSANSKASRTKPSSAKRKPSSTK